MEYVVVIIASTVSGLAGALVTWLVTRKKAHLDLSLAQAGGVDALVQRITNAMNQTVQDAAEIATLNLQVKIKDARLQEFRDREAELLRDHGAVEERERQCLERIEYLVDQLERQAPQIRRNKTLSDQIAQQTGILDKLRREGIWKPNETELTALQRMIQTETDST